MKRLRTTIVIIVLAAAFGAALHSRAEAICLEDNYGSVWTVTLDLGSGDIAGTMEWNGQTALAYGQFGDGGNFLLTALWHPDTGYYSFVYDGIWSGGHGSGTWYNANGDIGGFSIWMCSLDGPRTLLDPDLEAPAPSVGE
jgi:hypothetical protein